MKNKKTLVVLAAVVVLVAVLVGVYFGTRPAVTEGQKEFTLMVVHADGTEKKFEIKTDAEYVGEALQDEKLIEGEMGAYGLYVKVVDGEQAIAEKDGAYWGFFIGEEYAMQGIDQTPIEEGKVYKLAYTLMEE